MHFTRIDWTADDLMQESGIRRIRPGEIIIEDSSREKLIKISNYIVSQA